MGAGGRGQAVQSYRLLNMLDLDEVQSLRIVGFIYAAMVYLECQRKVR